MRQLTPFVASAAALMAAASVTVLGGGSGPAAADGTSAAGNSSVVPLSSYLRECDWRSAPYVPSETTGTGFAVVGRAGNTVTADVHMTGVIPDIWYGVRLVEVPRPGIGCGAGAPGVGFGQLYTDDAGNGSVTVQAPVMQGATGAWVSVEGPLGYSAKQMTGDFRTSDYVASI
jgi:hypothetical protein